MADLKAQWSSLGLDPDDILPGPPQAIRQKLQRLRELASRLSAAHDLPELLPTASAIVSDCASRLLDRDDLDTEYAGSVRHLLAVYPKLMNGVVPPDVSAMASGLGQKLTVFHQLYRDEINPTQTRHSSKRMLGGYLIELGFVTREQLDDALQAQKSGEFPGKRVGDILQHKGIVTRAELDQAIEAQMLDNFEG